MAVAQRLNWIDGCAVHRLRDSVHPAPLHAPLRVNAPPPPAGAVRLSDFRAGGRQKSENFGFFFEKKIFFRVKIRSFGVEIRPNFWVSSSKNAKKKLPQGEPALGSASLGAVRLSDFRAGSAQNDPKKVKIVIFSEKKIFRSQN